MRSARRRKGRAKQVSSTPWMPFFPADFVGDTLHLSTEEIGAYMLLICHYWRAGGLPDSDEHLARIARLPLPRWYELRPMLQACFKHPGWRHKRIESELKKASEVREKYQRRAAAAAKSRWNKRKLGNATSIPQAYVKHGNSQPQSHKMFSKENKRARGALAVEMAQDFQNWYDAYPHKVGRAEAARAFGKARLAGASPDELAAGLERYR